MAYIPIAFREIVKKVEVCPSITLSMRRVIQLRLRLQLQLNQ